MSEMAKPAPPAPEPGTPAPAPSEPTTPDAPALPTAAVRRQRRLSIVWLVPLVAAAIAGWLAYDTITSRGPRITISFESAEGLEAGRTAIRYRDVEVGKVEAVELSPDLSRIVVTAQMVKGAGPYMTTGTRFWIVRPRVGAGGVSGLGTLLSGAYVEVDPGQGDATRDFTGLEEPPQISSNVPGKAFTLRADTLGSVSRGAPLYYRGIEVGQVLGYQLAEDERSLEVEVFVRDPHDRLVRGNSRFWNASGIGVSTGAGGLSVNVASVQSLLVGGIEFDTPRAVAAADEAAAGTEFQLFASADAAQEAQFTRKVPFLVNFEGQTRGLSVGAPVETRGIRIGSVADVRLAFSEARKKLLVQTLIEIEPERVQALDAETGQPLPQQEMQDLVARGLRAQLRTGNLLTGELYVDLDFYPEAPVEAMREIGEHPVIPAMPTDLEAIQASLTAVLDRIAQLPIEELVGRLNNTAGALEALVSAPQTQGALASVTASMDRLQETLARLDTAGPPLLESLKRTSDAATSTLTQARDTLAATERTLGPSSALGSNLDSLMRELQSAARSIRVFADYLERHPEALVRGRGGR